MDEDGASARSEFLVEVEASFARATRGRLGERRGAGDPTPFILGELLKRTPSDFAIGALSASVAVDRTEPNHSEVPHGLRPPQREAVDDLAFDGPAICPEGRRGELENGLLANKLHSEVGPCSSRRCGAPDRCRGGSRHSAIATRTDGGHAVITGHCRHNNVAAREEILSRLDRFETMSEDADNRILRTCCEQT